MPPPRPPRVVVHGQALPADAATLDALARLALGARRQGARLEVRGATAELRELAAFLGLAGVLGLEPGREAEEREQPLGLEEERELADPPPG
jgi:hypothetical protein